MSRAAHPQATITADRFKGLDGLRGMALLMVIIAHLNLFSAGWTGMQSFFVLSGFLITRILLSDYDRSATLRSFFARFYMRRVLRVFPVYYSYLIVLTVIVLAVPALSHIREELPAAYLYYYNFHMVFSHEHTRTLSHLWSMSVEEQFYLVWPVLVAFIPRRLFPYLCVVLVGLGPIIRQWLALSVLPGLGFEPQRILIYVYILTFSYLDAFAAGALINFVDWRPRLWQLLFCLAAALAVGFAVNGGYAMDTLALGWPLFAPYGYQYVWGYSVVNVVCVMVICGILGGGAIKRWFSWGVFDFLGKRSYSSYVVHFPILALSTPIWQALMESFGRVVGTLLFSVPYLAVVFAIAAAFYRYIEMPANNLKDRFRPGKISADQ